MWSFVVLSILLIIFYVYKKSTEIYSYWDKKGVKGPKPCFIFGNLKELIWPRNHSVITIAAKFYNEYQNEKVIGVYQGITPTLVVRDPDIIKEVLIKKFTSFNSRGLEVSEKPIMNNLFTAKGSSWEYLRKNITPVFTIKQIKAMMPLFHASIEKHVDYLDNLVKVNKCHEIRTLNIKYTLKSVNAVAFGKNIDTHSEEISEAEYFAYALLTMTPFRNILYLLKYLYPGKIVEYLHLGPSPLKWFFLNMVKEILHDRKVNSYEKNDFIGHLIKLKNEGGLRKNTDQIKMSNNLIVAQTGLFYGAGFETSSSSMSLLLHELALHPEIQARCHKEIDLVMKKYNNHLDYDALKELQYVSMAMDETLRKYPIGGIFARDTVEDHTFEDINLTLEKGIKLWIPILAIHNDPKYFPEPEKFDPERFLPENRIKIQDYYYPFGGGRRMCIGMQFAKVQFLLGIAHFLYKFQVSPSAKTPKTISFDPTLITLAAKGGIWLNIEKRNKSTI